MAELLKYSELWQLLCEGDESILIEVKRGSDVGKSSFETVSAFSNEPNAGGGYILFGVERRHSSLFADYEVTGVVDADKLKCDFATQCRGSFSTPIRPILTVETVSQKLVVVAYIPEANPLSKPIFIKSRGVHHGSYRRVAGTDQLCTEDDLAVLYQARGHRAFDESPIPETSLEDIDQHALGAYRKARRDAQTIGATELASYSDEDLLHAVGASGNYGNQRVLTAAGLILFGRQVSLRRNLPMMRVDYIRVDGRSWVPDAERRYQTIEKLGPLLTITEQVVSQVLEDIPRSFLLVEGQMHRRDVPLIPRTVLREAIVNAVMHRSYQKQQPIQIIRFSNRLEIINPGYSLKPEERLGEPGSLTRNPKIAAALHDAALAETKGTGIKVMTEAMQHANLTAPIIDSSRTRDEFRLVLLVHHLMSDEHIRWLSRFKHCKLTDDEARALVTVRETGFIDNSIYRSLNHVDTLTASKCLQKLRDAELIVQKGKGATTYYEGGNLFDEPTQKGGSGTKNPPLRREDDALRREIDTLRREVEPMRREMTEDLREELANLPKRAKTSEVDELILRLCNFRPMTLRELAGFLGKSTEHIRNRYVGRLIKAGRLGYLDPENITSRNQRYVTTEEAE
jgi:ATP-dependent DNA helicase RecG